MPKTTALPFSLDPLDKNFVPPKPKYQGSINEERLRALEARGDLIKSRKRNGHYLSCAVTNEARLYNRGEVSDLTGNFSHIASELMRIPFPPGGTLLGGEIIRDGSDGRDDLGAVSSLTSSDAEVALRLQKAQGMARYMVFNVFVLGGAPVDQWSNRKRIDCIHGLLADRCTYVFPAEVLPCNLLDAQAMARKERWEGLVLCDANAPTAFALDGNEKSPPRPDGSWKWKITFEEEFIATGWVRGTKGARHEHRMGKLNLAQVHPFAGDLVPCGEVGIGFTDKEREWFADDSRYPCEVEVEYENRNPPKRITKGRVQCALDKPRFSRLRTDKSPASDSCLLPESLARNLLFSEKRRTA